MYNYRKGKKRIKIDNFGSLYIDYDKISSTTRPIIYIGGQMEHRFHIVEQTGFTGDPGHNLFTGSWFYDYPISDKDKGNYNVKNFGNNLCAALELSNIGEIDLITESYGGLIGAYVSSSPLIHKVVAIHPPILGTPLANKDLLKLALKELEYKQKLLSYIITKIVDSRYGFEQENALGIHTNYIEDSADLSKLLVVGSSIDYKSEKSSIIKSLYDLIYHITNKPSDGFVVFDKKELKHLDIKYLEEKPSLNHLEAGSTKHIEDVAKKTLKH